MVARLVVDGPPVAAGRPRAAVRGGRAMVYSPKPNVVYMDAVRVAWDRTFDPGQVFERGVPLAVDAVFYFPRLAGHFGSGRNAAKLKPGAPQFHTVRPDADNILKLVLDALAGRAFADDAQICEARVVKLYSERPRTEIEFRLAVVEPAAPEPAALALAL